MRRALLLLPLALLLVACGGGASGTRDPVAAAADATTKTGSQKIALTGTIQAAGQTVSLRGSGAFDSDAKRGQIGLDLQVPGSAQTIHIDEIVDGSVFYVKPPPSASDSLPPGKQWLKVDLQSAGKQLGVNVQQLSQLNQGDPSQLLQYLRASSGKVKKVGEESVRGTDTTHYRATIDLRKVPNQVPREQRAEVRHAIDRLIQLTGTRTYPMDVWVDGDDLVRRIRFAFDLKQLQSRLDMTLDLYDFGTDVDAEPPPADQVVDASKLGG
jgi:hypothetical protein